MHRIIIGSAVMFLAASAVTARAQSTQPTSPSTAPAASHSQADCGGFISGSAVSRDLFVVGGEDDDTHSVVRQFHTGNSVYLASRGKQEYAVGTEYSVIRPAKNIFGTVRYSGQTGEINRLGTPFEDVGRVRVTHVSSEGTVAQVTFACMPVAFGDILVPYSPRPIPQYTLNPRVDKFTPTDEKKTHGFIVAATNNYGVVGKGNIVYLNVGESSGIAPGSRMRIYKELPQASIPPETLGEAIVLSVHEYSCVAIIVDSFREISAGDRVEEE